MKAAQEINHWLINEGRLLGDIAAIVEGYVSRLVTAGVPLSRANIAQRFANPLLIAWGVVWTPEETSSYDVTHSNLTTASYIGGPFEYVLRHRKPLRKSLLGLDRNKDHAAYLELAEKGGTELFATLLTYADGSRHGCTFMTSASGGFEDWHINLIQDTRAGLSSALEPVSKQRSLSSLLQTYLGKGPAAEVIGGTIQRGEQRKLEAVVMFADLRGFTQKSETWEESQLLDALNSYFEVVVRAVEDQGGDILKFMGDGILSIFPITDGNEVRMKCTAALTAAMTVIASLEELNKAREEAENEHLAVGIGLNLGPVTYGNIGSLARLDFTVLGPAVNLASRVQDLTKTLGRPILATASVAQLVSAEFDAMGAFEVRGVANKVELFAPK